ncbi:MAG: AI-2E family transporter [Deltaproteobacteria bacterium]|nr:MAG: AI-2E family transporter [Deltaproteobacteria bacterium]
MTGESTTQPMESATTQELASVVGSQERRVQELQRTLRFWTVGFVILLLVLLTVIFRELAGVLKPLFVAIFVAYLIYPIVDFLVRRRVPKLVAYAATISGILAAFYLFAQILTANVRSFMEQAGRYQLRILQYESQLNALAMRYNLVPEGERIRVLDLFQIMPQDTLARAVGGGTSFFLGFAGSVFVILLFMIFVLLEMERIPGRIDIAFGSQQSGQLLTIVDDVNRNVQRYILVKVVMSFLTAAFSIVAMALFGLDFFILFGAIIFFFNFIPYVGSWVATLIPMLVGILQFDSVLTVLWMGLLLVVIQTIFGSILEPRYHGRNLNLSPLLILVALGFWAWLWGVIGMVLAIPIMVVLRIVLEQWESTRPISVLMSNVSRQDVLETARLEHLGRRNEELEQQVQASESRSMPAQGATAGP